MTYPPEGTPTWPAQPVTPASGEEPKPPAPTPSRSVLVTVLMLLVTLLLGIMIGLILSRTVLAPEPESAPSPEAPPAAQTDAPAVEQPPYPDLPPAEVLEIIEAQFRRDAGDPYAVGDVNAPVVVAEWADYRCSYCARFTLETLPEIQHFIDEGLVRLEWNDFPVLGPESIDLAVAGRAAADQGLFHEMSHAITSYQFIDGGSDFSVDSLVSIAESAGIPDPDAFRAALEDSEGARAEIDASYNNALQVFGQASTPKFLVNSQYIGGFLDGPAFSQVIEQELLRIVDNS